MFSLTAGKGKLARMPLSQQAKCELQRWCDNVMIAHNVISHVEPKHKITTDASLLGWGAEHEGVSTAGGGELDPCGSPVPLNYFKMLAICLAVQNFAKGWANTHIRVMCDNSTAVNVINHMRTSHSDSCNSLANECSCEK